MQRQSDAEFNMMFMLNNMDLNQEGPVSSEDRLFMAGNPRTQPQQAQINPFGAVRWEQGQPVYSSVNQQPQVIEDSPEYQQQQLWLMQQNQQQQQQQQYFEQQQQQQQQLQQQVLLHQHHQLKEQQQMPPQNQQLFDPNTPQ